MKTRKFRVEHSHEDIYFTLTGHNADRWHIRSHNVIAYSGAYNVLKWLLDVAEYCVNEGYINKPYHVPSNIICTGKDERGIVRRYWYRWERMGSPYSNKITVVKDVPICGCITEPSISNKNYWMLYYVFFNELVWEPIPDEYIITDNIYEI